MRRRWVAESGSVGVAWYRFSRTWRSRLPGYIAVGLLVGVIGGVGIAAVASARRTDSSYETSTLPPYRSLLLHVVGLGVFNHQVLQDDIDETHTGLLLGSPTLARRFAPCCEEVTYDAIQVAGGPRDVSLVDHEYATLVQRLTTATGDTQLLVYESSVNATAAQRAIRPQAIALGVFGVIAGLAAVLIGSLTAARQLSARAEERFVLRALGAAPAANVLDGVLGLAAAVIGGSLLALLLAFVLSAVSDFGPVAAVDPARGWNADWTVFGLGVAVLVVAVGSTVVAVAFRQLPGRDRVRPGRGLVSTRLVRWVAGLGAPVTAVAGVRFAVEPGRGRTAVPVRSVVAGTVVAVMVLVGTLTFGDSLGTLISHPTLYGWNFDEALFSTSGFGPLPSHEFDPLIAADHLVAASTPVWFADLAVNGTTVPAMAIPLHASIQPPTLTGRQLADRHDIVLGSATLAALHLHLGDTVVVSGDGLPATRLRVVGTAALPAIGPTFSTHSSIDTGALLPTGAMPSAVLDEGIPPVFAGPNALFVRFAPGVTSANGHRSLERAVSAFERYVHSPPVEALAPDAALVTVEVLSVQRPAEIANYRAMGATPGILAGTLAGGTLVALALTLIASVRRRRRDFAVLKTLGFTGRQLSETVAWQATTTALAGLVIGIPAGVALGRWLWSLFARELSVTSDPTVPALLLLAVGVAALVLANLVAALPGRLAGRTSPALVLRSE